MSKPQTHAAKAAPDAAAQTQQPDAAQAALAEANDLVAQAVAANHELAAELAERKAAHDALVAEMAVLRDVNQRLAEKLEAAAGAAQRSQQAGQGTHIRVAALADGYFRAGQQFSRQPRELAVAELTAEQLQAIRADSRLVVVDL